MGSIHFEKKAFSWRYPLETSFYYKVKFLGDVDIHDIQQLPEDNIQIKILKVSTRLNCDSECAIWLIYSMMDIMHKILIPVCHKL